MARVQRAQGRNERHAQPSGALRIGEALELRHADDAHGRLTGTQRRRRETFRSRLRRRSAAPPGR